MLARETRIIDSVQSDENTEIERFQQSSSRNFLLKQIFKWAIWVVRDTTRSQDYFDRFLRVAYHPIEDCGAMLQGG